MNENKHIRIIPSQELARLKLSELAGRCGVILEDLTDEDRSNIGYMVHLDKPFLNSSLWYIPEASIEYA